METPLRFVLTVVFLTYSLGTEAAMWSSTISNEKMRAEIDLASFMRQGSIVTAWDREVYFVLEQARPGDFYFKSAKSLMRYNCSARTADLLMKVYYAEDGSEITTITAIYYGKPNFVIPDTEGEQKFEHVCQYKTPEENRLAAEARKKIEEEKKARKAKEAKEADKTGDSSTKKLFPGNKAKAAASETLVKSPPRSLPILKPSGTLPKQATDASKGSAQK